MVNRYIAEKGDIVWTDLTDARTKKILRVPALIISNKNYNRHGIVLGCLISPQRLGSGFEVQFEIEGLKGVVLCDKIQNIDIIERNATFASKIETDILQKVIRILTAIILK